MSILEGTTDLYWWMKTNLPYVVSSVSISGYGLHGDFPSYNIGVVVVFDDDHIQSFGSHIGLTPRSEWIGTQLDRALRDLVLLITNYAHEHGYEELTDEVL